ncbi:ribonuclease P protein component [soil metagenome]
MTETLVTPPASVKIERLKKRPDFLRAAKAPNLSRGAVFMQMRARHDGDPLIRVGFTATKKIGGSVQRNRAKRRLREAARLLLPLHGRPSCDYVFIARGGTGQRAWGRLLDDVKTALLSLAADLDRAGPGDKPAPHAPAASDSSVSG